MSTKTDITEVEYALLHASHRKLKREHEELENKYLALLEAIKVASGVLSGSLELREIEEDK